MKNLFNLTLAFVLVISLFSCKKGNDLISEPTTTTENGNTFQSVARANPHANFSIGNLAEYVLLGTDKTEVHPENNSTVNNGKVGVGPAGKYHHHGIYNNIAVYTHNGVEIKEHGTLNGTMNTGANLGPLKGDLNRVCNDAEHLNATVTMGIVNIGVTITGNGGMNVINMNKLDLDNNENLILSGSSTDIFIINVEEDFDLKGNAKIITANGAVSSHVLINLLGKDKTAKSDKTTVINGTIISKDRKVEVGNVNGQVLIGGDKLKVKKESVVNYIPFNG